MFWPGLLRDVKQYVECCLVCHQTKNSIMAPVGLLQPLPLLERIWEDISLDFITGLPFKPSKSVIMVVVDRLTKYD